MINGHRIVQTTDNGMVSNCNEERLNVSIYIVYLHSLMSYIYICVYIYWCQTDAKADLRFSPVCISACYAMSVHQTEFDYVTPSSSYIFIRVQSTKQVRKFEFLSNSNYIIFDPN